MSTARRGRMLSPSGQQHPCRHLGELPLSLATEHACAWGAVTKQCIQMGALAPLCQGCPVIGRHHPILRVLGARWNPKE